MVSSLEQLCCQGIIKLNIKDLKKKVNYNCYNKVVDEQIKEAYEFWKQDINMVNLELEIEDIEVSTDMYFDDPIVSLSVKKKNSIEGEYELYHPSYDPEEYEIYYQIALRKGYIDEIFGDVI